jgi:hypothetical protein
MRLYLQMSVGERMLYLRYLCLFTYSGVYHILSCVCLRIVLSNTYCLVFVLFCFFLRLVPLMLLVSLDCPFLIATSVFSSVYHMASKDLN